MRLPFPCCNSFFSIKNRAFALEHSKLSSSSTSTKQKSAKCDRIGPPNEISNLRTVVFHVANNESPIEKIFRFKRREVQDWNEAFWTKHNTKFFEEKTSFITDFSKKLSEKRPLTSDEMSIFYKKFLDENWKTHQIYNIEWYRKNILLLVLAMRVKLYKISMWLN